MFTLLFERRSYQVLYPFINLVITNKHLRTGRPEASQRPDIPLSGEEICERHCQFVNEDGVVTLVPETNAKCFVNGQPVCLLTEFLC